MVRRGQHELREVRKARRAAQAQLDSPVGTYQPDREGCRKREWETPCDDTNTVRVQFIVWTRGKDLVDFVVNLQVLTSDGWRIVEYYDCCHGYCHLHPNNPDVDPRPIAQLDTVADVARALHAVEAEVENRARIIRDER